MNQRVKAIIIQKNRILTIERFKPNPDRIFWAFPGGGVEKEDKNSEDALIRECKEEVGVKVLVIKNIWNRIFEGHEEKFYICKITGGKVGKGYGPEYDTKNNEYEGIHKPKWLKLSDLHKFDLKPTILRNEIIKISKNAKNDRLCFQNSVWSGLPR